MPKDRELSAISAKQKERVASKKISFPRKEFFMDDPVWGIPPEKNIYYGRKNIEKYFDEKERLEPELEKRYGTDIPIEIANRYLDELGLGKHNVYIKERGAAPTVGAQFNPDTRNISLNPWAMAQNIPSALVHEISHLRDYTEPGMFDAARTIKTVDDEQQLDQPSKHFKHFERFEPEMAQSMASQRAIEEGLKVNPAIINRYPWLKKVKPMQTNKLANPWQDTPPDLPPEIWNLIFGKK